MNIFCETYKSWYKELIIDEPDCVINDPPINEVYIEYYQDDDICVYLINGQPFYIMNLQTISNSPEDNADIIDRMLSLGIKVGLYLATLKEKEKQ